MNDCSNFNIGIPQIELPDMPHWHMWADAQYEIIKKYIVDFEKSLDQEHEVGLLLTSFGTTVMMQVTEIGYEGSVLMIFKGYVDGREATLIQHISQINFLLTSMKRPEPEKPKVQIGFVVNNN